MMTFPAGVAFCLAVSAAFRTMFATMAIEAYCVKCKAKKVMQDPVEGTTKNGKPITKGKCPDCGTTICRIGAAK